MTIREIQKKVKQFKKKFGLLECTYAALEKATTEQGYTIVEFNHVSNNDAVNTLIISADYAFYTYYTRHKHIKHGIPD